MKPIHNATSAWNTLIAVGARDIPIIIVAELMGEFSFMNFIQYDKVSDTSQIKGNFFANSNVIVELYLTNI